MIYIIIMSITIKLIIPPFRHSILSKDQFRLLIVPLINIIIMFILKSIVALFVFKTLFVYLFTVCFVGHNNNPVVLLYHY